MTLQTGQNTAACRRGRGGQQRRWPSASCSGRSASADGDWLTPRTRPPTHAPTTSPTMTADQALAIIATEYDTGAGGGQISNSDPRGR